MVHQDQTGFILVDELHPLFFHFKAGTGKAEYGQQADQGTPKDIRLDGHFMTGTGQGDCFIVIKFFDAGLQNKHVLSSIGFASRNYTDLLYRECSVSSRIVHNSQPHFPCCAHIRPRQYAHTSPCIHVFVNIIHFAFLIFSYIFIIYLYIHIDFEYYCAF